MVKRRSQVSTLLINTYFNSKKLNVLPNIDLAWLCRFTRCKSR